jgi:uncharacterized protein
VNTSRDLPRLAALTLSALALTGCFGLNRVSDPARFYVLSALPAESPAPAASRPSVGLGRVDLPNYLLDRRIAVRQGANGIRYSQAHWWAERLDKGLQRALGANLSSSLSSDRVLLSNWLRGEVSAEVYVSVQRFEGDDRGQVVLEAQWRITSPGGETTWRADHSLITRQGPGIGADPDAAVTTLSQAVAELSRQIAVAMQTALPSASVTQAERRP